MRMYEVLFIFSPESGPEAREQEFKSLDEIVRRSGGTVPEKIDLGKKPLGYPIRKHREGYVVIWDVQLPPERVADFRRALELEDWVMKYTLILKPAAESEIASKRKAVSEDNKTSRAAATS